MSEGELKTQINVKSHYFGADTWETKYIPVKDLETIIDEMKKNFPNNESFGFKHDGTKIYDVWDWFKKYFGDR